MKSKCQRKMMVECVIEGVARYRVNIEMTKEQYDEFSQRIDDACGYDCERVAEELLDLSGVDLMRDVEIEDLCVDTFIDSNEQSTPDES